MRRSVKFGSTSLHTPEQLTANLLSLIPQLAVRIPNSPFSNIQSLHIKTSTSISLPIYNCTLDDAGRFSGPTAEEVAAVEKRRGEKAAQQELKEQKEREREVRRKERSATKEGKGRAEKKRKAPVAGDVEVDETDLPLDTPLTDATETARPVKKSKKAPAKAVEEIDESVSKRKSSKKAA